MRPLIPAAALIVGVALGAAIPAAAPVIDHSLISVSAVAQSLYTAFPVEDSDNCYWDALTQGNGRGTSFVTIAGHVFYAPLTAESR